MHAFAAAGALIERAIRGRVTPAATVEVGRRRGVLWRAAFGTLTYAPGAAKCAEDTIFDLASLTKIIATTSLVMSAVERGTLRLDTPVSRIEPRWLGGGREGVTIRHLLDHSSGLPAHARVYESARGKDGFLQRILETPLAFAPGSAAVYSDLGFMLLGFLIERAERRPLDALFSPIAGELGEIDYRPAKALLPRIAPTESDPWRGRDVHGEVHDENAFALGGVAAHAGLFGTIAAVGTFARTVLDTFEADTWLAARATLVEFATRSRVPGSSRALGWDTMLPTSSCGTHMSARAIGHTGFTGTSLWIDPEKDAYVALLTNRVHPTRSGEGIQELRRAVADAVMSGV